MTSLMTTFSNASLNRGVSRFTSLYESFQALTSVQVSHFVEWFSGSAVKTNQWTVNNVSGTGTLSMTDAIDGGLNFAVTGESRWGFGDLRQYDYQNCEMIFVAKRVDAASMAYYIGLTNNQSSGLLNTVYVQNYTAGTYYTVITADGSTASGTDTAATVDENWHTIKLALTSSNVKTYIDGVLEITDTTNLPAAKLQPMFSALSLSATKNGAIRYIEVYNTSVSITSSLYERLSALTQVMGQRVVETFSGNGLQTDRWDITTVGSSTVASADSVDGGILITTGATSGDRIELDFNNKRQYDNENCVCIGTMKLGQLTDCAGRVGFIDDALATSGDSAFLYFDTSIFASNYGLQTLGTGTTDTDTGLAADTNYHVFKVDCGATNVKGYIDGVLKATNSVAANLPANKLQPHISGQTRAASAKTFNYSYLEAYNKLTTETDYPSVYELFNPLTTVGKAHFWEWFSGNDIDTTRWTKNNPVGTGTFAMDDTVDGGFKITTGANSGDASSITFNNKKQYSQTASKTIVVMKRNSASSGVSAGLGSASDFFGDSAAMNDNTGNTYKTLLTADGSETSTASDVAIDTAWTTYQLFMDTSDAKMYINGVLKVTKTTSRPRNQIQPTFMMESLSAGAKDGSIRYIEAKNT